MDDSQARLIALAQLGRSNARLRKACAKTDGEVNYGLMKAKAKLGLKASIRQGWRDGTSEVARMVEADVLEILTQEVKRSLPQLIIHKPAEIVEDKTPPQPPPQPPQP